MKTTATIRLCTLVVWSAVAISGPAATGQDLGEFEKRMTEFTLANGMKFLVVERHEVPVVACVTYADVGAVDDGKGQTGLAHLLEHMAFKGTETIGTRDYAAEAPLMAQEDEVRQALRLEQSKAGHADMQRIRELQQRSTGLQQKIQELLTPNEFEEIYKLAGGIGLNARTNYDSTLYMVSLPSNKIELWMLLESDRFSHLVLRQFYEERNVVMEERRQRTENNPVGRLGEEFVALAYRAHPYGAPSVGHMSDLQTLTRAEARTFFSTYYCPSNLTAAIVGDIDPGWARELAQDYFGRITCRAKPDPVRTQEPPQLGERRVVIEDSVPSIVLIGYHKFGISHPDEVVFDMITDVVGSGRTARLPKALVKNNRVAMSATAFSGTPGYRYPGLYVFYAVPSQGHTAKECEEAIYVEIERLKSEPVTAEELEKARTHARTGLIRSLTSNQGLASQLAFYDVTTGDWRHLFRQLERIDRIGAQDIQRVAKAYFTVKNRTVGMIETIPAVKKQDQESQK